MRVMSPCEWFYAEMVCLDKLGSHIMFWFLWRRTFMKNFNRALARSEEREG